MSHGLIYAFIPWSSFHQTPVVVSCSDLAILELVIVGKEASNKVLVVSLLESSSLGCTKVLSDVEPCCCWFPSTWTCGVTGYLLCIHVPCSQWPEASLGKKFQRAKQFWLLRMCINQVVYLRIKLIGLDILANQLNYLLVDHLRARIELKEEFCRNCNWFVKNKHKSTIRLELELWETKLQFP